MNAFASAFEKLLERFLLLAGQDPADAKGSSGFEFVIGRYGVAIFSTGDDQLVVEVQVTVLQPSEASEAPLLLMLHRLNAAARSVHDWVITIDAEETILISKSLRLHDTDTSVLEAALSVALDRAASLEGLIARFSTADSDNPRVAVISDSSQASINPLDRA